MELVRYDMAYKLFPIANQQQAFLNFSERDRTIFSALVRYSSKFYFLEMIRSDAYQGITQFTREQIWNDMLSRSDYEGIITRTKHGLNIVLSNYPHLGTIPENFTPAWWRAYVSFNLTIQNHIKCTIQHMYGFCLFSQCCLETCSQQPTCQPSNQPLTAGHSTSAEDTD